ncbi:MAG TPA: pyridoxamine 5'-phosphate oxidase [Thermoleophilaceae bacterium]|jgi:pyridoxamine 5'-phosphate oxidase|nr:pyridoxamine 5'-phosphate oxidase [Thermoleophilaceae bacterium]
MNLDPDPLRQFKAWFDEAAATAMRAPEAVALATATPDGAPSVRMVLMKGFDERGFTFFSNYESRKGQELAANARAALLFHWDALGRQVRIEGPVARLDPAESAEYIESRPRASQISALISPQSRPVESREWLEQRVAEYADQDRVPLPGNWGGYRLAPVSYEFWRHRDDRLHDRIVYLPEDDGWRRQRLAP